MKEPIDPEVIEPDESLPADLRALRKLAHTLDSAFPVPGTTRRIGLAPTIGLIPGFGDAFTAIISTWIVIGALRHRVPTRKVLQMIGNIILDLWIGSVPVLGDIFDFFFNENLGNVEILLKHRDRTRPPRSHARIAALSLVTVIVIVGFGLVLAVGTLLFLDWFFKYLQQLF